MTVEKCMINVSEMKGPFFGLRRSSSGLLTVVWLKACEVFVGPRLTLIMDS